jgi:hypothetical protein
MAATVKPMPLTPEAADAYWSRTPQDQLRIQETVTCVLVNFPSTESTRMANSALYAQDFYQWTQATAALILTAQWQEIDLGHLTEELNDVGVSQYHAVSGDLYQVLLHLLKWQYQPERRRQGHSWRDSIAEHRDRIDRLCTRSPSLRGHLPAMLNEEYPRARRRASIQTRLPLTTFPETCPWNDVNQVLDVDFWPEGH